MWGVRVGEHVLPGRFMEASFYRSHVCPHERLCAFREQPGHSLPHCFPMSEQTVCDLDVLPCVATSRLPAVWDEEAVGTTSEKVVPGLKAPGKRD